MTLREVAASDADDVVQQTATRPWHIGGGLLPNGYESYLRIFHPIEATCISDDGKPTLVTLTWEQVAQAAGSQMHPLAQWPLVALRYPESDELERLDLGNIGLTAEQRKLVMPVLARHTDTTRPILFAMWTGFSYLQEIVERRDSDDITSTDIRDYLVWQGDLEDINQLHDGSFFDSSFSCDGPQLWWPADKSWVVASEIDLHSTYIGGSDELINALHGVPELETAIVSPDDGFSLDSDLINGTPENLDRARSRGLIPG